MCDWSVHTKTVKNRDSKGNYKTEYVCRQKTEEIYTLHVYLYEIFILHDEEKYKTMGTEPIVSFQITLVRMLGEECVKLDQILLNCDYTSYGLRILKVDTS